MLATLGALALCALGAAPSQSCAPLPGGGGGDAGPAIAVCGDGVISGVEQCDGVNFREPNATCAEIVGYVGGTLRCDPRTCNLDLRGCTTPSCGNGVIEAGESCEGTDLRGATCPGETVGTVRCDPALCNIDTSGCKLPSCGNGRLDSGEYCDGTDFGDVTCENRGGTADGTLKCFPNCTYDDRACVQRPGFCGDGVVQVGHEQCEGDKTCQQYAIGSGFPADYFLPGGTLHCDPIYCSVKSANECKRNTSHCGNGIIEPQYGEACDGSNIGFASCLGAGFLFGTPRCSVTCQIDVFSGCWGGCQISPRTTYCQ